MLKTMLLVRSPSGTRQVQLRPSGTTLGRGADCDVVLDDDRVSRAHAKIYQDPFGRWIIEDLGSHNGLLVDGQRVETHVMLPDEQIDIQPFALSLLEPLDEEKIAPHSSVAATVSALRQPAGEEVVISRTGKDRPLIEHLNEITERLLKLSSPSDLYSQVCDQLARKFDTLAAVVRVPSGSRPLAGSCELLTCRVGKHGADMSSAPANFHMSQRVLDAVRAEGAAVMARSVPSPDKQLTLTIVDVHSPHLVLSAPVTDISDTVDALYLEILEEAAPPNMFEFIEAVARQVDFARKSLLYRRRERMATIGQTMSGLAHCIKNILNGIRSGSTVVDRAIEKDELERVRDGWQIVRRNNEMLGALVLDMLALARDSNPKPFPTDINDLAEQVCHLLLERAGERDITITFTPAPELQDVKLDPTHFYRCLLNLTSNALEACSQGGNVRVRVYRGKDRDRFTVSVTDDGAGITAETRRKLFDDFFTTKGGRGTGLGLPVTKKLIAEMGGAITFHSVPARGTRFVFALPA